MSDLPFWHCDGCGRVIARLALEVGHVVILCKSCKTYNSKEVGVLDKVEKKDDAIAVTA